MIVTSIARKASCWFLLFLSAIACTGQAGAQAWTQQTPTGGPPAARTQHTAVYDASGNNMIMFGGTNGAYLNDVWVLSNANGSVSGGTPTWTQLTTSGGPPAGRTGHTAVYDAAGNNMIVFGGFGCPSSCGNLNDVWVLSHANGSGGTPTWSQLTPSGGPPAARYAHTAVYDAAGNNLIVFGGCAAGTCPASDVWVLSHANGSGGTPTWALLIADGAPGSPAKRYQHTAVYDSAANDMIVFGGYNASYLNDVWVLSNANGSISGGTSTWSQLTPSGGPPAARRLHTAVYDAAGNNMVVFGGYNNVVGYENDVWVLSQAAGATNIPVSIDIRPNTAVNTISLTNGTNIPVAILSSASFNAPTQVDKTSLTFGHSGNESSLIGCDVRATDVNADGYKDLVCHFNGTQGSFQMGDTTGYLKGKTTVSNTISGSDSVVIIK